MSGSVEIYTHLPTLVSSGTRQNAATGSLYTHLPTLVSSGTRQNAASGSLYTFLPTISAEGEAARTDVIINTFPITIEAVGELPEPEPEVLTRKQPSSYSPKIERKIYTISKNEIIAKNKIVINDDEQILNLIMSYVANLSLDEEEEAEFIIN